jgi:hypothetical protein
LALVYTDRTETHKDRIEIERRDIEGTYDRGECLRGARRRERVALLESLRDLLGREPFLLEEQEPLRERRGLHFGVLQEAHALLHELVADRHARGWREREEVGSGEVSSSELWFKCDSFSQQRMGIGGYSENLFIQ